MRKTRIFQIEYVEPSENEEIEVRCVYITRSKTLRGAIRKCFQECDVERLVSAF